MTKAAVINGMMKNEKIYVIFSQRTRMPYVVCDPETYDDQIYLYLTEEEAKAQAQRLVDSGEPAGVYVLSTKAFLPFYMNLYFMGVNCIVAGYGTDSCYSIQLKDFVKREIKDQNPNNPRTLENPELSLTMLYFIQEVSRKEVNKDAVKELDEEMKAHFNKARLLMPFQRDKKGILLERDGKKFQPLFTDFFEYEKFDREKKLIVIPVDVAKVLKNFPKEADGVSINPAGVNVVLNIAINKNKSV